jgi:AcrR family transcriptional regulator
VPRDRARLDQRAIAAAFAPDGLHGTSAAEVARRARVAKPTLFAHGGSKEALFLACVEAAVERVLDRLYVADAASRGRSLESRAAELAQCLLEFAAEEPDALRLLAHTARHRGSGVAAAVDAALARIPARIAAAVGGRDAPLLAAVLHGGALAVAAQVRSQAERAEAAALLGRALAAAAGPPPAPEPRAALDASAIY